MELSERIRRARARAGLTQRALAESMGVSPATVAQWERGKRNPKFEHLVELCDVLRMPLFAARNKR